MNNHILPLVGFTLCKLLWGIRESQPGIEKAQEQGEEMIEQDIEWHFVFSDLLRMQGYSQALTGATKRKAWFDDKVHPVEFETGDLVQVYNSKLEITYETTAKLLLQWSLPRVITSKLLNSYTLCNLDSTELYGTYHVRCLQCYPQRTNDYFKVQKC